MKETLEEFATHHLPNGGSIITITSVKNRDSFEIIVDKKNLGKLEKLLHRVADSYLFGH